MATQVSRRQNQTPTDHASPGDTNGDPGLLNDHARRTSSRDFDGCLLSLMGVSCICLVFVGSVEYRIGASEREFGSESVRSCLDLSGSTGEWNHGKKKDRPRSQCAGEKQAIR